MLPQVFWKKIFNFPTLCMCQANRMCRIFPHIFTTKYVILKIRHTPLTPPRSFASQNNLFLQTDSKTLDNFWSNGGCSAFFRHSGDLVASFKHLMIEAKPNQTRVWVGFWVWFDLAPTIKCSNRATWAPECRKKALHPPFDQKLSKVFESVRKNNLFWNAKDLRNVKAMCRIFGMTYFVMKIGGKIRHMRFARHMQSVGKSKIFFQKSYGSIWTPQI